MTEPPKDKVRYVLILGKFRVMARGETFMKLNLGGSTTMTVNLPPRADVREGDILTLYTEVLQDANPSTPSIQ